MVVHHGKDAAGSHVAWTMPNDTVATQYFGNWYARYRQDGSDIEALLMAQLEDALSIDMAANRIPSIEDILPVLKSNDWRAAALAQLERTTLDRREVPFITRPFVGDLLVTYVTDTPDSMQFVTPSTLSSLGLSEADLHDTAIRNLTRRLPSLEIKGGGGRYAARLDRNYDASMLLILDQWRDRIAIQGDLVVAVPARDEVLLCGVDDPDTAASLAVAAVEIRSASAYELSAQLLQWSDSESKFI
jgi:uncharacterized protein YtpQ (UPF0354 family)